VLFAEENAAFRAAEAAATGAHFERMRSERIDTAETSALNLDLLRDMMLINSHIVAAAAYPVLERTGELLPSPIPANGG
jgi:phosphate:Na+ symporter